MKAKEAETTFFFDSQANPFHPRGVLDNLWMMIQENDKAEELDSMTDVDLQNARFCTENTS